MLHHGIILRGSSGQSRTAASRARNPASGATGLAGSAARGLGALGGMMTLKFPPTTASRACRLHDGSPSPLASASGRFSPLGAVCPVRGPAGPSAVQSSGHDPILFIRENSVSEVLVAGTVRDERPGWDADQAIADLYQAHYLSLTRIAALLANDIAKGEEIVQDAFALVASARRRLPGGGDPREAIR